LDHGDTVHFRNHAAVREDFHGLLRLRDLRPVLLDLGVETFDLLLHDRVHRRQGGREKRRRRRRRGRYVRREGWLMRFRLLEDTEGEALLDLASDLLLAPLMFLVALACSCGSAPEVEFNVLLVVPLAFCLRLNGDVGCWCHGDVDAFVFLLLSSTAQ